MGTTVPRVFAFLRRTGDAADGLHGPRLGELGGCRADAPALVEEGVGRSSGDLVVQGEEALADPLREGRTNALAAATGPAAQLHSVPRFIRRVSTATGMRTPSTAAVDS